MMNEYDETNCSRCGEPDCDEIKHCDNCGEDALCDESLCINCQRQEEIDNDLHADDPRFSPCFSPYG